MVDTSALEKQIDEMVYALYGLTPEGIALFYDSSAALRAERRDEK